MCVSLCSQLIHWHSYTQMDSGIRSSGLQQAEGTGLQASHELQQT